jgi:hypothetical protein
VSPSGTTEEEWYKIAADNYRDAEGHAFPFLHCVEVLHQLPKFNPMIDDADRSSDVVAEDSDGDTKPAASVNKIGAPMGASLKRPPGLKKAKKELLFRDTSLQQEQLQWQWGTGATAAIGRLQWQWGMGTGATAIAMAMALLGHRSRGNRTVIAMGQCRSIVFQSCCNSNGNDVGGATGQRRRSIAIAMAMGKEDWGTGGAGATEQCCNRTVIAMGQWGNDRSSNCFISRINVMYCGC